MFKLLFLLGIISTLIFQPGGCGCRKKTINPSLIYGSIKLNAQLSDTSFAINKSDTLKIKIELPDSLYITGGNADTTVYLNNLKVATMGLTYSYLDTISNKFTHYNFPFLINGDMESSSSFYFNKSKKPYTLELGIDLKNKGYYIINFYNYGGSLLTKDYLISASLFLDFNVSNKNTESLRKYLGNLWADTVNLNTTKDRSTTYVFKAE